MYESRVFREICLQFKLEAVRGRAGLHNARGACADVHLYAWHHCPPQTHGSCCGQAKRSQRVTYSPPSGDRIWLWANYNKIPMHPIFYLLKGDYDAVMRLTAFPWFRTWGESSARWALFRTRNLGPQYW